MNKSHFLTGIAYGVVLFFTFSTYSLYAQSDIQPRVKYAGVRSSIYGMRKNFPSPEGWAKALNKMSEYFPGSQSTAIWIVGTLAPPGCRLEFPKDSEDQCVYDKIKFLDYDRHEPYLNYFDHHGIKVFLQVEPGFANVDTLIDLVMHRYSRHSSVIGFGVDVEWYNGIKEDSGVPVTDSIAMKWETIVKSFNKSYRLFLKHYDKKWLCQKYRGDIIYVDDSQQFANADSCIKDFREFGEYFFPNTVMYQIGYKADKKIWGQLAVPPKNLGEQLAAVTKQECCIIWVDFTLQDVLPYK